MMMMMMMMMNGMGMGDRGFRIEDRGSKFSVGSYDYKAQRKVKYLYNMTIKILQHDYLPRIDIIYECRTTRIQPDMNVDGLN